MLMGPIPKPTPEKYCEYCGKKLERKQYSKKKEDLAIFSKRKYCDISCMRRAFVKQGYSLSRTRSSRKSANNIVFLVEGREKRCELCGSTSNIDVHHKDGDFCNNNSLNLMVVCRSCHLKIHNPKGVCKICGQPVKAYGLCDKHYQRLKKHGDPNHKPWSKYERKQTL